MKKRFGGLVVALLVAMFTPGCPCKTVDPPCFEQTAQQVESFAKTVEQAILTALPPGAQSTAKGAFDEAFAVVDAAIKTLADLYAAVQAGQNGDIAGAEQRVTDAVNAVICLIDQFVSTNTKCVMPNSAVPTPHVSLTADAQDALAEARKTQAELAQAAAQ